MSGWQADDNTNQINNAVGASGNDIGATGMFEGMTPGQDVNKDHGNTDIAPNTNAAALYNQIQQNGLSTYDAAKALGVSQNALASYLNSGIYTTPVVTVGDRDVSGGTLNYNPVLPSGLSLAEVNQQLAANPGIVGSDGTVQGPSSGANYLYQGMTPAQIVDASNRVAQNNFETGGNSNVDLGWQDGPSNQGGMLGNFARSGETKFMGNIIANILAPGWGGALFNYLDTVAGGGDTNQALSSAARSFAMSEISNGAMGSSADTGAAEGGNEVGGSAGIGSGTTYGGGDAVPSWSQDASSILSKPGVSQAVAGAITGGPQGALKGYLGGQLGSLVNGAVTNGTDSTTLGNAAGQFTSSVVSGKDPLTALVNSGVGAATSLIAPNIPGWLSMPAAEQNFISSVVMSALKGQTPTPALITQATNAGLAAAQTHNGGW